MSAAQQRDGASNSLQCWVSRCVNRMPNEISIYGKRHIPGGLAGVYVSGAGEAGANSVSANYLCIAAETHLYVTACKTPVQGAMPYKEISPTSLYET